MANYTSQQDENECDTLSSQTFSGDESGLEDDDDNDFFLIDGNKKARKKRHDAKTTSRPIDKVLVRKSIVSKDHEAKASEKTTPKAKKLKTIKLDDRTPLVRPAQPNHDPNENDQTSHRLSEMSTQIDRICEYTLVLMHCILYKINYYNRKTHFDKYIKYNIVVYVSIKTILNPTNLECLSIKSKIPSILEIISNLFIYFIIIIYFNNK